MAKVAYQSRALRLAAALAEMWRSKAANKAYHGGGAESNRRIGGDQCGVAQQNNNGKRAARSRRQSRIIAAK